MQPHLAITVFLLLFSSVLYVVSFKIARSERDLILPGSRNCSALCTKYKATCRSNGEGCTCTKFHSTFAIHNKTCIAATAIVNDNNCLKRRDGKNEILPMVDLARSSSNTTEYILPVDAVNCSPVNRRFSFLQRNGTWGTHTMESGQQLFKTTNANATGSKMITFQVVGHVDLSVFAGRIIRVDLICNESGNKIKRCCILLKAKGTISDIQKSVSPESTEIPVTRPDKGTISTWQTTTTDDPSSMVPYPHAGIVSIDDDDQEDNKVVVATVITVGVVICVTIMCISACFIARYHRRSRRQDGTSIPRNQGSVNESARDQVAILMSSAPGTESSEPVYSELPDVTDSGHGTKRLFPSTASSMNAIWEEPCIVRNQAIYSTMPKARKNTDPLPVIPLQVRPRTPDQRSSFLINACTDNTRTTQFLDEMNRRGCMSLQRNVHCGTRRERSSTDVDLLDDVLFGGVWMKPESDDDDDDDDGDDDDNNEENGNPERQRSESFYQQLKSNPGSKTSLYESLNEATKESPKTRFSTLERMNQKVHYNNYGLSLQDESDREHPIVLDSNQNSECQSQVCDDGEEIEAPEYFTLEGPGELYCRQESTEKIKSLEAGGSLFSALQRSCSEGDIAKVCGRERSQRLSSEEDIKKASLWSLQETCLERVFKNEYSEEPYNIKDYSAREISL